MSRALSEEGQIQALIEERVAAILAERDSQSFRKRFLKAPAPLTLVAPLLTVLLVFGGWLYQQGVTNQRITTIEGRVSEIERTYLPVAVHDEKEKAAKAEFDKMQLGHEELQRRLDAIDKKLDGIEAALRSSRR